ncbi:MAG: hypothetical protein ABIO98_02705, partial [Chitinophagales bacterium]
MTKITINIDTGDGEPKVTTVTENPATNVPKTNPAKEETPIDRPKEEIPVEEKNEESPKEEKKDETSLEKKSTIDDSSEKADSEKMNMTAEEHAKMSHEKKIPSEEKASKEESSKADHSKMNMTVDEHSKMQHANAPMGIAGHDHHKMIADFRLKFFVALGITIPVMVLSPMLQKLVGVNFQFPGSQYVAFALSSVVFFYGGFPFLKGFWNEVKNRAPGMMILIAVAISTAYIYSAATVFGLKGEDFFWELATMITIMLLG